MDNTSTTSNESIEEEEKVSVADIFKEYESKLMQLLPMDDLIFMCMLSAHNVITEDELDVIQSQPTTTDEVAELCHIISVDIISCDDSSKFYSLHKVMTDYEAPNDKMEKLADEISSKMPPPQLPAYRRLRRINMHKGNDLVGEEATENTKRAVCMIRTPNNKDKVSTGFFGNVKIHEKPAVVLVTSCNVLGSEEIAANSLIAFDGVDVQISLSELLVKNSYVSSDKKKLDFAMIEIDWIKLKAIIKHVQYLDLTKLEPVEDDDFLTIIQFRDDGCLLFSSSTCSVKLGCLLIYRSGSKSYTSSGPVLKAVDGKYVVVGLHRGSISVSKNCGTKFSDILKNMAGKDYNTNVKSKAKAKVAEMKLLGPAGEDKGYCPVTEAVRVQVKNAVCLITAPDQEGKMCCGTGFFGYRKKQDKTTFILVTNYHVIGSEKIAEKSLLEFEGENAQLSLKDFLVEATYECSNMEKATEMPAEFKIALQLDFAIMEIDWKKLKEKHPSAECIDLQEDAPIKNDDCITIIQHPAGGKLSFSSSTCIIYKHLLLYECETAHGSSGGPILKATTSGLEIVGLHRGGCEDYNYGSKFGEILLVIFGNKDNKRQNPKDKVVKEYFMRLNAKKRM